MDEKKLIPQPHLLLWLRLLIYRFMTKCVYCQETMCMCVEKGRGDCVAMVEEQTEK